MSALLITVKPQAASKARPHPDALPQERGNRSQVSCIARVSIFLKRLEANIPKAAIATVSHEFSNRVSRFSLSPGVRAGVKEFAHA